MRKWVKIFYVLINLKSYEKDIVKKIYLFGNSLIFDFFIKYIRILIMRKWVKIFYIFDNFKKVMKYI